MFCSVAVAVAAVAVAVAVAVVVVIVAVAFADIVFVVAVAVVAVIVAVVLVSVRVAGSDLCWVATGTNFILPLLCPFESRLDMGCPIVSVLVVHYSLGTSHSAGR